MFKKHIDVLLGSFEEVIQMIDSNLKLDQSKISPDQSVPVESLPPSTFDGTN